MVAGGEVLAGGCLLYTTNQGERESSNYKRIISEPRYNSRFCAPAAPTVRRNRKRKEKKVEKEENAKGG